MKIPAYSKILTMQNFLNLSGIKLCINGYDMLLGNRVDTFAEQNCGSHDFCAYDKIGACVLTEYDTILYHKQVEKPLHLYTVQELVIGVGIPKEGYKFEVTGIPKQDWVDLGIKKGVHELHWRYGIQGVSLRIIQYSDRIDVRIGAAKNGCIAVPEELVARADSSIKSADETLMEHAKNMFNRTCESKAKAHKYIRQMAMLELTDIKAAKQLQEQRDANFRAKVQKIEVKKQQEEKERQRQQAEREIYLAKQAEERQRKQAEQRQQEVDRQKELERKQRTTEHTEQGVGVDIYNVWDIKEQSYVREVEEQARREEQSLKKYGPLFPF